MIHINTKNTLERIDIDDDNAVKVSDVNVTDYSNWGDEDCTKMVSTVDSCTIEIDKSVAHLFKNIDEITFVRYNYYRPAFHINGSHTYKHICNDGSIVYTIEK